MVRVTHWITAACFGALLVSGFEIVVSHPRFYWGETGTVLEQPLFAIPIPSSRSTVPTGYGYVLPDQNGWSRSLHFQAAWLLVLAGVVYVAAGLRTRHFRDDLLPARRDVTARALLHAAAKSLRPATANEAGEWTYNGLQRLTYLGVVFALFPLVVWTGLAMSDGFVARWPGTVTVLGGRQSARTLHFAVTVLLSLFLLVHLAMVYRVGFARRVRAMITGRTGGRQEGP
ncbi:MAG: cytochrome b/b6 domain-containing protein [Acidobacteriota bacterium]|nr:cytochrome b/b6 domain-containing protein [Acidobacteriota bacterium]